MASFPCSLASIHYPDGAFQNTNQIVPLTPIKPTRGFSHHGLQDPTRFGPGLPISLQTSSDSPLLSCLLSLSPLPAPNTIVHIFLGVFDLLFLLLEVSFSRFPLAACSPHSALSKILPALAIQSGLRLGDVPHSTIQGLKWSYLFLTSLLTP